jgi:hypothetical protein
VNGDQSTWSPYFAFVNKLEERINDNVQGALYSLSPYELFPFF